MAAHAHLVILRDILSLVPTCAWERGYRPFISVDIINVITPEHWSKFAIDISPATN